MLAGIGKTTPAGEHGWGGVRMSDAGYVAVPAVRSAGYGSRAYQSAGFSTQDMVSFLPPQTSGDSETLPAMRLSLDRTRDLIRNDPHAGAGVARLGDMLIGSGWQLIATPDARALGISREAARELGRQIQTEFKLWTRDPRRFIDTRRRLTFNGILRLLGRTFITAGEAAYVLGFDERPSARYRTSICCIDPDRISNPHGMSDTRHLRGGIEFDDRGVVIAGHIREAHPMDWWAPAQAQTWTRVPRETEWGRPVFVHGFEGDREDQSRAITLFSSIVSRLRMITKHGDLELASATVNAMMAAFIESDLPLQDVAQRLQPAESVGAGGVDAMTERMVDYYEKHPARIGGVRIPVLLPNTKVSVNNTPRQTTAYPSFQTAFLQSIAARLGISYEQLSMDWSRTNYSSARAALNEVFAEQIVQPLYMAFLEDACDLGHIKAPAGAPDFWDLPEAWVHARWIGPGRGYVDPVKEAEAAALRMEGMISTLEIECAEQGLDYEDTLDQIAREEEELKSRGLTRLSLVAAVQANKGVKPDSEEATGPAGPGGEDNKP